jgi:sigma-B regulation protein RsbU (phosphoserine phosphatase)
MLKVTYSLFQEQARNPGIMMTRLNEEMSRYTGGNFITACFAIIDIDTNQIVQANAGHWPLLVQRSDGFYEVGTGDNGIPLGWMSDTAYSTTSFHLEDDDRVIFYTDCFVEARNRRGEMVEQNGFRSFLLSCRSHKPDESADAVLEYLSSWIGAQPEKSLPDDATIIIIDIARNVQAAETEIS